MENTEDNVMKRYRDVFDVLSENEYKLLYWTSIEKEIENNPLIKYMKDKDGTIYSINNARRNVYSKDRINGVKKIMMDEIFRRDENYERKMKYVLGISGEKLLQLEEYLFNREIIYIVYDNHLYYIWDEGVDIMPKLLSTNPLEYSKSYCKRNRVYKILTESGK